MAGTQEPESVSTKTQRIAALARAHPDWAFVSLAHHIDLDWMHAAYRRTRKSGAAGVDGESAAAFSVDLGGRLRDLLEAAKSGQYRAPPVRRVYIPKGESGQTRPIGIPTFADKLLQRAVTMLLEPIFEQDFHDDSYGFRPGRSAHQLLTELYGRLNQMGGGWVIELDIRSYFDTIDHALLREFVRRRVRDGVITRLIDKWLKAGVMEDGQWHRPEAGSPQGGVISPLLANVFLHVVLDEWFASEVQPRLLGRSFLLRYADDAVLVFANESDARRVLGVLAERFERFGLTLHPEKTRLVRFYPPRENRDDDSFDLLGFTHYWARSGRGRWVIRRKTAKDRFRRALKRVSAWCSGHRHWRLRDQHAALTSRLRGHFNYYGVSGNYRALASFRYRVEQVWLKWLKRRSQRGSLSWARLTQLYRAFALPPARIVHRCGIP